MGNDDLIKETRLDSYSLYIASIYKVLHRHSQHHLQTLPMGSGVLSQWQAMHESSIYYTNHTS